MRRVPVLAANNVRKQVQDEPLPFMRRVFISAANNARKWVQGETLPAWKGMILWIRL